MIAYTQKQLKEMVILKIAEDITRADESVRVAIEKKEGYLTQVGYSHGTYGCNGQLYKGHNSGTLYAITARTQAIYIFG